MHDPHSERMSSGETRAASGLALVFAFRMRGMFMVLPVLATYGMDLAGATPALIGLAIGAYGLTQAIFQIPFGIISDRIGRRPVIYLGLVVFALGSVLAAQSDSIWGVIAGRVLQGAGAISAAVMALLSDLTREQHRTKAMAMIGMTIGLSFAVAMVVGPLLTRAFGLHGLFLATGGMASGTVRDHPEQTVGRMAAAVREQRAGHSPAAVNTRIFIGFTYFYALVIVNLGPGNTSIRGISYFKKTIFRVSQTPPLPICRNTPPMTARSHHI